MVIIMLYITGLEISLIVSGICVVFVLINLVIGIIRYKKIKNNKTVGTHNTLVKLKLNHDIKANCYDAGIHVYADKEKNKWVLIIDNPKSCDVYSFQSLEDYVLTVNGEYVIRSSMKDVVTTVNTKIINNLALDIFCKNKKYRFFLINKECRLNDNVYNLHLGEANKLCDIFDYILENK